MLKVRLMGTKNDIVWFQKILQRHPKVEVLEILIIPGLFEPPVRTLRATIPENESHIFR